MGVKAAAEAKGMTLALGEGNDPDTLGKKLVYVMDTAKFPFYQGEVYHQFHDDFQSPAYGKKYNSLANQAFDDGRLKVTGCPPILKFAISPSRLFFGDLGSIAAPVYRR